MYLGQDVWLDAAVAGIKRAVAGINRPTNAYKKTQ
jgi:hypothetical protein